MLTPTFSFPFPPISPGKPLQRNLRQMASERQLARTWIPLLTPPLLQEHHPPGPSRAIPPLSAYTLPSQATGHHPFSLLFSVLKIISRKHILTVAVGRKQRQVWKKCEPMRAVHLLLSRPPVGAENPRGQRPLGRETNFKAKMRKQWGPAPQQPGSLLLLIPLGWRRRPRGSGREARERHPSTPLHRFCSQEQERLCGGTLSWVCVCV